MSQELQDSLKDVLNTIPTFHCVHSFVKDCIDSYEKRKKVYNDFGEEMPKGFLSTRPYLLLMGSSYKERGPFRGLVSSGAAYRIRTYDVLIRSQTLYPAEVTPQRKTYETILVNWSQAQS